MTSFINRSIPLWLVLVAAACSSTRPGEHRDQAVQQSGNVVPVQYLEIVTPDVDATCRVLEETQGVSFNNPDPGMGNARTAALRGGGLIGVRGPMRETEQPVVRPYTLVQDIDAAVQTAQTSGAVVALPPTKIPGHGAFAIYILGGIEHGLWQL